MRKTAVRAAVWHSARCATANDAVSLQAADRPRQNRPACVLDGRRRAACTEARVRGAGGADLPPSPPRVPPFQACWWCSVGRWGIYAYQYPLTDASAVGVVAASDFPSVREARRFDVDRA